MTYRDDTAALQDRLGELEDERARLSGRVGGLAIALAEARDRAERAERGLRSLPLRQSVNAAGGRAFGCLGSLAVLSGCGALLFLVAESRAPEVDRQLGLTVVTSALPDVGAGSRDCWVEIASTPDRTEGCDATLRCRGIAIYSGAGRCEAFFPEQHLEFWDHGAARESPRFVVVQSEKRAIFRHGSSLVVFETE